MGLVVAVIWAGSMIAATAAHAVPAVEPEGGNGGYAEKRVESELSIHVPEAQKEAVWAHLTRVYGGQGAASWPQGVAGDELTARLSEEKFVDRYYDTPDFKILALNSGVRYRSRDIPDAPDDPKDDRQLIQVKITTNGDTVSRGEYKYPVKRSVDSDSRNPGPIMNLIRKQKYRDEFAGVMRGLGVDASSLRPVVRLDQHRRRVYFSDAGGPLATITLDEVRTRKWWARVSWTELELELGEVRYTNADAAERRRMEALRAAIRADLFRHFPQLYEDNMPKYTEAVALLEKKLPVLRPMMAARFNAGAIVLPLTTGVLAAAGLMFLRRRRRTPVPPLRTRTA